MRSRRWLHRHRRPVADFQLAIGDHLIARIQAVENLHLAGSAQSQLDRRHHRLAVHHPENERRLAHWHDGLFRRHQRVLPSLQNQADSREQARTQLVALVGQPRPQQHGAGFRVQRRVDGVNGSLEDLVRIGVHPHRQRLTDVQPRQIRLGNPEIQLHRTQAFQIGDVVAGLDVGAGADQPQAHRPSERRADHGLVQPDPVQFLLGAGGVQSGLGLVQNLLAGQVLALQIPEAFIAGLLQSHLSGAAGQLGLVLVLIQGNQRIARAHGLTFLEMDGRHPAGDFRADHHHLVGP